MNEEMKSEKTLRVLLADDHWVVREGLASIIDSEPDMQVVAEAANGQEAVELFREHEPDIVLMDLRMPVTDGVTAIGILSKEFKNLRAVVLTTYNGDEDIYRSLRAGAWGYLLKDAPAEELLETIRTVAGGKRRVQPEMAFKLAERVSGDELTEREMEVLRLMVQGKPNAAIAEELFIAESTVKFHVNNIFSKLGVTDRVQSVVVALKRGMVRL